MNKKLLLIAGLIFLPALIVLSLLVNNLQKQQEVRSHAAGTAPVCSNVATDSVVIIDKSSSMTGQKFTDAKNAAKLFVDQLATNTNNRVALVSFSNNSATATNVTLTNNFAQVKTAIDALTITGGTCIDCGVKKADAEIAAHGRAGIKKVGVLLTDGKGDLVSGQTGSVTESVANAAATASVQAAFTNHQMGFYTIGLGSDVNGTFLQSLATLSGGSYHASPTSAQLAQIYQEISQLLGKGSITGKVFNDVNANGVLDTTEPPLPNWTIHLFTGSSTTPQTFTSDAQGVFNIQGLCDGAYTLKEVVQTGWTQKLPSDPQGYLITISNGNALTNRNFGNTHASPTATATPKPTATSTPKPTATATPKPTATATPKPTATSTPTPKPTATSTPTPKPTATATPTVLPTATPTPQPVSFAVTLLLDGLGNRGDNANPDHFDLSNHNPLHPTKSTVLEVLNASNVVISTSNGTVTYDPDPSQGNFKGTFTLTTPVFAGDYLIRIRTEHYLAKFEPGVQHLHPGVNNLPVIALTTGDINNDNTLSILDYNLLLDCYSDGILAAPNCPTQTKKDASDVNDNGTVDQFDYNLFLRELSVQNGD